MFAMILDKIILANLSVIVQAKDRKIFCVGMANCLCQCPQMLAQPYVSMWSRLLDGIVTVAESTVAAKPQEEEDIMDVSDRGFKTAFTPLAFAPPPNHGFFERISNEKVAYLKSDSRLQFHHLLLLGGCN